MAIRFRKERGALPWECYWNNPLTRKRECAYFETRKEAQKYDSLVKHRLRFERESFQKEENEKGTENLTLEAAYLLYLKQKQFTKKVWNGNLTRCGFCLNAWGRLHCLTSQQQTLKA